MAGDIEEPFIHQYEAGSVGAILSVWHKTKGKLFTWRGTVFAGLIATVIVFLLNIFFLAWAVASTQRDSTSGLYIISTQECDASSRTSTGVHLVINLFSNVLLAASNYCMQALASPTRQEIDKAHAKRRWASIGVFSLRNFRIIHAKRTLLCCVLAITSIPLAFVYNSVVVDQLAANTWQGVVVYQSIFVDGPLVADDTNINSVDPDTWVPTCNSNYQCSYPNELDYQKEPSLFWKAISLFSNGQGGFTSNLTRLSVADCVNTYRAPRLTKYRNFLMVINGTNQTQNILSDPRALDGGEFSKYEPYSDSGWGLLCTYDKRCSYNAPDDLVWYSEVTGSSHQIDHCMAEQVDTPCQLGLSLGLLITVIVCNFIKALCLAIALISLAFHPVATIGDALDSFLSEPDPHTRAQSSLSREDVKRKLWEPDLDTIGSQSRKGRVWRARRWPFWARAASPWRWLVTMIVGCLTWIVALLLLLQGLTHSYVTFDFSPDFFGAPRSGNVFTGRVRSLGLTTEAVIANIPQVLISSAYLFYNGIFSAMCLTNEYASYASKRRGLRVSKPRKPQQRGSYFLSLPFRYSVPLIVIMFLLHWAVSQALFPVYVVNYDNWGAPDYGTGLVNSFGYSPAAIVVSLILGGIVLLALPLMGSRRYPRGFVAADNCSAALSAACHTSHLDADVGAQKLQYGVLMEGEGWQEAKVRKLGFSHKPVEPLVDGDLYEAPHGYKLDNL